MIARQPKDAPSLIKTRLETLWFVHRARRTPLNTLWIGDSHASFFANAPLKRFIVTSAGDAVVWLGPRLMYSLSREGFPEPLLPELRRGLDLATTPIILTAGEIDCRVHLVDRRHLVDTFAFVANYVSRVSELRARLGAPRAFLLGPVPPSDLGPDNSDLPRRGSLAERIAVSKRLEAELCESVICVGDPAISAVPLSQRLGDRDTGELSRHLSLDGCHVNPLGSQTVREVLARASTMRPCAVV
jgi:hypothetical protein